MEATHKPLHFDKWRLVQQRITDIPINFIWIIILFEGVFKYGDVKFWGYVRINSEPFRV
jgi:hypothetical protein